MNKKELNNKEILLEIILSFLRMFQSFFKLSCGIVVLYILNTNAEVKWYLDGILFIGILYWVFKDYKYLLNKNE